MTVVCRYLPRRSGVDLPRETVASFPVARTTVTHLHVSDDHYYRIVISPVRDIVGVPTIGVIVLLSFVFLF